jgi:deazaflavin-dependent oxidoreductase (nitroreductase family)
MTRSSSAKRALATSLAKYGFNPLNRALMRLGIRPPGTALLETTGRKSGKIRRNPVTDGLVDDTFWIVAEHGRHASYVRNIETDPRVRVLVGGRWRTGTAHLMQEDDPRERLSYIASQRPRSRMNAATVRLMGTELLTIRVDLDPPEGQ